MHTPAGKRPVICQLLHSLRVGGAEVLAARLARQLRDRFRFRFVCLDELGTLGEELRGDGFPVHVVGRRPGVDFSCALQLARLLRRERVDLLHVHQYTPFFYGMTARLLCRRPVVLFTEHGRWHPDYPRRKRILANRLLLERRDRVVGVGAAVRRALVDNEGIGAGRVAVIYNGIDLAAYHNGVDRRLAVRREIGVDAGAFLILQVARLDSLKDHLTALRTVERVANRRPDARLVLAGEGPERPAIQEFIDRHNLAERVRLLGLRTDVGRLLAAADAFLLTSISEGIPLTLIEAMAARLPVVATNVGGVGEVVADGTTGLLAPAGADAGLADHLVRLAEDAELRRRLGRQGRERAEALFSETQMLQAYADLYGEMLHG
jgi:glycosyltransferase involved in cell wall biosynthesis